MSKRPRLGGDEARPFKSSTAMLATITFFGQTGFAFRSVQPCFLTYEAPCVVCQACWQVLRLQEDNQQSTVLPPRYSAHQMSKPPTTKERKTAGRGAPGARVLPTGPHPGEAPGKLPEESGFYAASCICSETPREHSWVGPEERKKPP